MVANLNDKYIIADMNDYVSKTIKIIWTDDSGWTTVIHYYCFPCYAPGGIADVNFVAVNDSSLEKFKHLCNKVRGTRNDQWDSDYKNKHEFTVSNQFKYGQNNEKTFRFLVFQDPDLNPSQRLISQAANDSIALTYLRELINSHSYLGSMLPFGENIGSVVDAIVDGDLHSF